MSGQVETTSAYRALRFDGRDARRVLDAAPDDMQQAIRLTGLMRHLDRLARKGDLYPELMMAAAGSAGYIVNTGASAIGLTAASGKTIMYVNGGTAKTFTTTELVVGFDGTTSSAVPALVETVFGTKASNSTPGTASTSFTPVLTRGWGNGAAAAAAANACTSEPTVLVSHRQWLVTPNGGLLMVQFPLGREPVSTTTASTSGLQIGVRVTAPAVVNVRGYLEIEE